MATRWFPRRSTIAAGAMVALAPLVVAGQAQTVYRYVDADGRIVYSDRPPPPGIKGVETRRVTPNTIEVDQTALALERARTAFPVTLYTFNCGEPCSSAEALLVQRGIPYATVIVTEAAGADKLKKLTGELQAPVLQAGEKTVRGFSEPQWQSLLDAAGYPKAAPSRRPPPEAPKTQAPAPPVPVSGSYPKD